MIWGVLLKFKDGSERLELFGRNHFQAEFFLHLIPQMMVDKNPMVTDLASATLMPTRWMEGE
jgi:hypothetical protein